MKRVHRLQRRSAWEYFPLFLILLSFCFLAGILAGHLYARGTAAGSDSELYRYLSDFFQVGVDSGTSASFLSALLLYYRYPTLAFLLGFASVGVIGLPILSAAFGFFLAFSVGCFASAFGGSGVLLAFAAFGFRCLITFPCYYWLAVPAFQNSFALAKLSFGDGKRVAGVTYSSSYFLRFALCCAVLFFGVLLELYLTPHLIRFVCERIFI